MRRMKCYVYISIYAVTGLIFYVYSKIARSNDLFGEKKVLCRIEHVIIKPKPTHNDVE